MEKDIFLGHAIIEHWTSQKRYKIETLQWNTNSNLHCVILRDLK